MIRYLAFLPGIALLGVAAFLPQSTTPAKTVAFSVPPDVASQTNPVRPTPAGLAKARQIYGYDCAVCHGKTGAGDGDLASQMKTKMLDYRDPASLKGMSDGELFYIIQKGKGEMAGEGDRAKPDEIWNMVTLLRSFSKKQAGS